MRDYIEHQHGKLITLLSIVVIISFILLYLFQIGNNPLSFPQLLLFLALFLLIQLNFYKLTIIIDEQNIQLRYGIGLIKRTIALDDIKNPICVTTKWYQGIGIRQLQGGKLYNINFTDAVEVQYRFRKYYIRIGSSQPEQLRDEIAKRLKSNA